MEECYAALLRAPRGKHWKVDLRTALLLRRNASESVFAQIKHRGVAARGVKVPRWVKTDNHAGWPTGGCLLGLTLRRLAHEDGDGRAQLGA